MPLNQSPSWFHVDFISLAPLSASATPGHMHISSSFPKMLWAGKKPDLIIARETAPAFKRELTNGTWGCVQCGHSEARGHFLSKAPNAVPLQLLVVIPAPAAESDREVFMWLTLLASWGECTLHSHAPWDPPRWGLSKRLIWNDSDVFQETAQSCDGALQFYF